MPLPIPPMKPHPFAAPAAAGRAVLVALSSPCPPSRRRPRPIPAGVGAGRIPGCPIRRGEPAVSRRPSCGRLRPVRPPRQRRRPGSRRHRPGHAPPRRGAVRQRLGRDHRGAGVLVAARPIGRSGRDRGAAARSDPGGDVGSAPARPRTSRPRPSAATDARSASRPAGTAANPRRGRGQARAIVGHRSRPKSADATRHHEPARHGPVQVHDVAGHAASASADAGRVHLRLPQQPRLSAGRAARRGRPRARRALCGLRSARASSPTWRACASSAPTSSTSCASSASSATSSPPAPRPTARGSRSSPAARRCT